MTANLHYPSHSRTIVGAVRAAGAMARSGTYALPRSPSVRKPARSRVRVDIGCARHRQPVPGCQACVQARLRGAMSEVTAARRQLDRAIRSEHIARRGQDGSAHHL